MKGNDKIIEKLNFLLEDELTAINQYMVHSEMCSNWGYEKLHSSVEKRAIDEMKHAEKLIARILFLEGIPIVSNLNKINIGAMVDIQLKSDWSAEVHTIKIYNESIQLTEKLNDNGTRDLLVSILKDEERHVDWIETQLSQIDQIGVKNYLSDQAD